MTHLHHQLSGYVDGQLDDDERTACDRHIAGCRACRAALYETLQLVALEAAARNARRPLRIGPTASYQPFDAPRAPAIAPVAPPGRRPWRFPHRVRIGAGVVVAAAIAAILAIGRPPGRPDAAVVAFAAVRVRASEGRISYAAADGYRPYRVVRAGGAVARSETIAFDALAKLEQRNDLHGVAAALMLAGEPIRAASYLGRAPATLDVAADRALLQISNGQAAQALITLDQVLSVAPRHPQALWNRALALRDLGLALSAAETFEAVAALREPGWSAEAHQRALALSDQIREHKAAFEQLALVDGPRLADAPDAVTPQIARRFPGMARLMFYDGVRGAASAAAVRALAPLAHTLDLVDGGDTLTRYVARVAASDFAARAPLARRYAAVVAGARLDAAAARDLVSSLRAAHVDDILLGALVRTTAQDPSAASAVVPELRRLADASGDPWFRLLAVERAANAMIARGDHAAAEAEVLPALASCEASRLDYRCVSLAILLADSYRSTLRLSDAQRLIDTSAGRLDRSGEWYVEETQLAMLAQLAMLGDDVAGATLPVARAYTRELVLREPARCDFDVWGSELIALLLANRVDLAGARTELAHADDALARCPASAPNLAYMLAAAYGLRDPAAGTAIAVDRLREQIVRDRKIAGPGDLVMHDHIEGRLLLDRDRTTAVALLERAIARADALPGDINARKARAYSYSLLMLDAGRAARWDRVWELLEQAARAPVARRCALGVAAEHGASVVVVRDHTGATTGALDAAHGRAIDAPRLIPEALRAALRGCPAVEVQARPPVQGLAEILPADIAWSYQLDRGGVGEPSGAGDGAPDGAAPAITAPKPSRLVIADTVPPAVLGMARLAPWRSTRPPDVRLEGPAATPSRALAELADATFVEIHSHGMVDVAGADASFLMLSPESDGRYALTAAEIRSHRLRGRPIVILAACHAAATANHRHESWSLPAAFAAAGARAVIASTGVIDDDDAGELFDDVRARIEQGRPAAIALRDARAAWLTTHPAATWVRSLIVFQ